MYDSLMEGLTMHLGYEGAHAKMEEIENAEMLDALMARAGVALAKARLGCYSKEEEHDAEIEGMKWFLTDELMRVVDNLLLEK